MNTIRCLVFNFLFYVVWTPLVCIGLMPTLIMPRKYILMVAVLYQKGAHLLEKFILGLDYEIRGQAFRPPSKNPCLIACKHYSAYETTKLFILFDDPAIILKKELLSLPVFGWFLSKLDVIALDRGKKAKAMNSLFSGAQKVVNQRRPIVIFPQGTRVKTDTTTADKPYKTGIGKLYVEMGLPIYPVAINSGVFWPRNSFWKKPGKVVFEFLPRIEPGLDLQECMKRLEDSIEPASQKLVEEAQKSLS